MTKIIIAVIFILLGIGAYYEIRDFEDFRIKHDCVMIAFQESRIEYHSEFGGSFTRIPEKLIFQCSNGEQIER